MDETNLMESQIPEETIGSVQISVFWLLTRAPGKKKCERCCRRDDDHQFHHKTGYIDLANDRCKSRYIFAVLRAAVSVSNFAMVNIAK